MGLRYLRLWLYFVRFSFSKAAEFRVDFFFRVLMDVVFYAIQFAFYDVLLRQTDMLGGWDRPQIMVFVASYCLVDALHMTIFANNMWWFGTAINRGDLDFYLTKPVAPLFFLGLRDFAANSLLNVACALGLLIWALGQLPEPLALPKIILLFALLLNGVLLHFFLGLLMGLPVFWTQSPQGYHMVMWALQRTMERPDRIFKGWIRRILFSILPFALMASVPVRLALEPLSWGLLTWCFAVTGLLFALVVWIWSRGLRIYSSASS